MTTPLTATPKAAGLLATPSADFEVYCGKTLADAKASVAKLKALPKGQGVEAFRLYDWAATSVANAGMRSGLGREVHPDEAVRGAAERCEQALESFNVELSQDRGVYDALLAIDSKSLDGVSAYYLMKTLREFRRAGVDKDDATRAKVKALNEELVKIGQAFARNIRDDVRTVRLAPKDLEGLPKDWLDAHQPGADGLVAVTTNTPDYLPVMTYAKSAKAREQLWRAAKSRAYPANEAVLKDLVAKRHALATLLGYASWAAFTTETKMVKTQEAAADFIERGRGATLARAKADMATLLERKKKDVPGAEAVEPWEQDYYEDRVKNERFGLDSQALRAYFEYGNVQKGVMETTARLFGLRYLPVADAKTWHPSVETFDVYDGEKLAGRIHLDMHPRENKYKHAAQFGLTVGRDGVELPEAALVCNFPEKGGLMQHGDVETFFHEFGHLLHEVLAGRQSWGGVSGIRTEWDFVEVPSMLLQEWPYDAAVLAGFARHHQTGEVIPASLVKQLKEAHEFGVGLQTRRQFFLAALSLELYRRPPGVDANALTRELQEKFLPFRREWVEGSHFELAFGHLEGYSAAYYTYLWSTVIAKDLLTRFQAKGMLDAGVAGEYRQKVLEPGGSREAATLVADFLGRPYDFRAFEAWLSGSAAARAP